MMKTMMKSFVIGGMLLVMPVTGLLARPHGGPGMQDSYSRMDRPRAERMIDNLSLTPDQREALQQHRLEQRKKMINLRSKLALLRTDLAEAALKDKPNMRQIDRIADKIGNVKAQMTKERIRSRLQVRGMLTDEQQEMMDSRRLMMSPGKGGCRGMR